MIIILINFNDMKIIKRVKEDLENNSNLYKEKNISENNNNYLKK